MELLESSFYHLERGDIHTAVCSGLACFAARHDRPETWREAESRTPRVYCLGKCFAGPATGKDTARPTIGIHSGVGIVLERIAAGPHRDLRQYRATGGFDALQSALTHPPERIIADLEASHLRGRGGAAFPTGLKWRRVAGHQTETKYVIANADEGDPGAFIDRFILEDDPFCLIEAMTLAGYAVGSHHGIVYLRGEYPAAHSILGDAIESARREQFLGENLFGSGFSFDIEIFRGKGNYICGEETALLNSIEGKLPMTRVRPPYPTDVGLWGKPTLVNNVETLSNIPWIVRHGGAAYHRLGFSTSRGTKAVSLNSLFNRPGLYEIDFGSPVRWIVEELGGGLRSGPVKGVIIGGPLAGIIPPNLLDTTFGFDELHRIGACVGHGGIIAFDARTTIPELVHHVFSFGAYESCLQCTPCREGNRVIEALFKNILTGNGAGNHPPAEFREIVAALKTASLCGFGTGLGDFAASVLTHYTTEVEACFTSH